MSERLKSWLIMILSIAILVETGIVASTQQSSIVVRTSFQADVISKLDKLLDK